MSSSSSSNVTSSASSLLPLGLSPASVILPNNETRYFVINNNDNALSSSSSSHNNEDYDNKNNEVIIIIILHPSTRIKTNDDPYAPAYAYESQIRDEIEKTLLSSSQPTTFDFDDEQKHQKVLLVYPASRKIGESWWCWGAGKDNDLCSSPVDGTDQIFMTKIVEYMHEKLPNMTSTTTKLFLFGYSGGARMAWRISCDSIVSRLFHGVAIASGLLPQQSSIDNNNQEEQKTTTNAVRAQQQQGRCDIDTLPSKFIVVHGDLDVTTSIGYAEKSVEYIATNADCKTKEEKNWIDDNDDVIVDFYSDCVNNQALNLSFYRKVGGGHFSPDTTQMEMIFQHWQLLLPSNTTTNNSTTTEVGLPMNTNNITTTKVEEETNIMDVSDKHPPPYQHSLPTTTSKFDVMNNDYINEVMLAFSGTFLIVILVILLKP